MKVVMLAGAGGTGKTSLVNRLELLLLDKKVKKFYSTTRKTFERLGLTTERAGLLKSPEEQIALQGEVFADYYSALFQVVDQAAQEGMNYVLCDRSPFDYNGYVCAAIQTVSQDELDRRDAMLQNLLLSISRHHHTEIYLLPHAPPWATVVDDGYRFNPPAKNLVWNATIHFLMGQMDRVLNQMDEEGLVPTPELMLIPRQYSLWKAQTSDERAAVIHRRLEQEKTVVKRVRRAPPT